MCLKSSNNQPDDLLLMGTFSGVHGIRGALKVFSHAESPDLFQAGDALRIVDPKGGVTTREIEWARPHKAGLIMALKGVATREDAEALVRSDIYVRKADLPALEEDTYYWFELIGISVMDVADGYLGKITSVFSTGSNDVYVVADEARGKGYEILIPALASVIQSVDLDAETMTVDLPPELKDPGAPPLPGSPFQHGFD